MEIQQLCIQIDKLLDEYTKVESFKIGKTNDPKAREDDYHVDDYAFFKVIDEGSEKEISEAEKDLIHYFTIQSRHKKKCANKQEGGGSPDATMLYIALKIKDISINDLNIKTYIFDKYFSNANS